MFLKAENDFAYGESMQFITEILKDTKYLQHLDENETDAQFSRDATALKDFYQFTDAHYYYDLSRVSSSVDYLLNKHIRATNSKIQPSILWEGGNKFPSIRATQGVPIRLYDVAQIEDIIILLVDLKFDDLLVHYDYEKMQKSGVYKLTRPENLYMLEDAFDQIQDIFLLALMEDLLVISIID